MRIEAACIICGENLIVRTRNEVAEAIYITLTRCTCKDGGLEAFGYDIGKALKYDEGYAVGYKKGFDDGHDTGFNRGFREKFSEGDPKCPK